MVARYTSMKFTIGLADLERLLKTMAPRPKSTDTFTLSACAARVFVECEGDVGGTEALVFEDGAVRLPVKSFRKVLETYRGRQSLTLEASADGLCIDSFSMRVTHYQPHPRPPANFQVFRGATLPTSANPTPRT
jgi:hypothetical protein